MTSLEIQFIGFSFFCKKKKKGSFDHLWFPFVLVVYIGQF